MSMGKNVANSVMAQNVPLDTNLSTNRSAFDIISSCSDFSAVGLSGFPMTRRERLWSEPSLHSVFPHSTWFIWSFIMTPDGVDGARAAERRG
jgi:hypothetical protein